MWRLLGTIVDDKNLRQLIAIFSVSAVLQGVALAMMIPFLQELLGGGPRSGTVLPAPRRRAQERGWRSAHSLGLTRTPV